MTETFPEYATLRPFDFQQDTFAFPNELICEYQIDPSTGATRMMRRQPAPTYALRCFVVIRSVRQFFYHARFDPSQKPAPAASYPALIRKVIARNPRYPDDDKLIFPGYTCLRQFSQVFEQTLKDACGRAWRSYVLRSHWRMIFHVSRRNQEKAAESLCDRIAQNRAPIVHVVRFPQLTINHGLLLYNATHTAKEIEFSVYDPNAPEAPASMTYDRERQTFFFPANRYWAGGAVDAIEIYRNWLY